MSDDIEILQSSIPVQALKEAARVLGNGFSKDPLMRQRIQESQNGQIITLYEGPCAQYFPHSDGVIVNNGAKYLLNNRVMFQKSREKEFLFYEHPQGAVWVNTSNEYLSKKEFFLNGEFLYNGPAQAWRSCLGGVLIEKNQQIYLNGTQFLCNKGSYTWHAHPKGVVLVKLGEAKIFSSQDNSCQKIWRIPHALEKFSAKYGYFFRNLSCDSCYAKTYRDGIMIHETPVETSEWHPHPDGVMEIDYYKPSQIYLNNRVLTTPLTIPLNLRPFIWKQWDYAPQGVNCSDGKTIVYLATTTDKTFVYHAGEYLSWRSHEQGILLETKGKSSQEKIISLIVRKS